MALQSCAQDAMWCDMCESAVVLMHCNTCLINLCKGCVGEHLLEGAKDHKVVRFQDRVSDQHSNKCTYHSDKRSDLFCQDCSQPICSHCIASGGHSNHKIVLLKIIIQSRKKPLVRDQRVFTRFSLPSYQIFAKKLQRNLIRVEIEYHRTIESITRHGKKRCSEVNKIVSILTSEAMKLKKQQVQRLQQQIRETERQISFIQEAMNQTNDLMDSQSLIAVSSYIPKCHFKQLPEDIQITTPTFEKKELNLIPDHLSLFGSLKTDGVETDFKFIEMPPALWSSPIKDLLEEPKVVSTIETKHPSMLYNVACLGRDTIFTTGNDDVIQRICLKNDNNANFLDFIRTLFVPDFIRTSSGYRPWDIAVNREGNLIYSDRDSGAVLVVKDGKATVLLKSIYWIPLNICSTFSGDLLVIMNSNDHKQTKVVRYSGNTEIQSLQFDEMGQRLYHSYDSHKYITEIQSLQFDEKGQPLYHSYDGHKYITENGNLDICVADCQVGSVVVVDPSGKLRFRYSGVEPTLNNNLFCPRGITTDSQCQLLISDIGNDCIHLTDQDGQFLRYIDCGLEMPWGICTDQNDNLFVAECKSKKVKKIQYQK